MRSLTFRSSVFGRKPLSQLPTIRNFCAPLETLKMTPEIRRRNSITAFLLIGSVVGFYYFAKSKMMVEIDDINANIDSKKE
jgi:hypothetical protein